MSYSVLTQVNNTVYQIHKIQKGNERLFVMFLAKFYEKRALEFNWGIGIFKSRMRQFYKKYVR